MAEIPQYIYSTQEEVFEILRSICNNPKFIDSDAISIQDSSKKSCSLYPDRGFTIIGKIATDFVRGNFTGESFTGEGLEEGLLIITNPESEFYPSYLLVEKTLDGWYPHLNIDNSTVNKQEPIASGHYIFLQGRDIDYLALLDFTIYDVQNDGAHFRIDLLSYKNKSITIESIFKLNEPNQPWVYLCNSVNIPTGTPFPSLQNVYIEDMNTDKGSNGYKDLIFDVSIRYWPDLESGDEMLNCDAIYNNLVDETYTVIFNFDGHTLTPSENIEWLQNIYKSNR